MLSVGGILVFISWLCFVAVTTTISSPVQESMSLNELRQLVDDNQQEQSENGFQMSDPMSDNKLMLPAIVHVYFVNSKNPASDYIGVDKRSNPPAGFFIPARGRRASAPPHAGTFIGSRGRRWNSPVEDDVDAEENLSLKQDIDPSFSRKYRRFDSSVMTRDVADMADSVASPPGGFAVSRGKKDH